MEPLLVSEVSEGLLWRDGLYLAWGREESALDPQVVLARGV